MARQKKGVHSMKKDKPAVSTSTKPRRKRWTRDDTELTLLGLPAAIWYAVFCYLPMFGLIIAFKNFKITPGRGFLYSLFHSDWAGFDNFKFFLTSNTFTMLLRNTLLYNILFIVLNIVIPVTLAVLINQIYSRIASKAFRGNIKAFGGKKVVKLLDYAYGLDGLPKSEVLKFLLEDNCSIVVRPSGTEPKLKIYISVSAENREAAEKVECEIVKDAEKWFA